MILSEGQSADCKSFDEVYEKALELGKVSYVAADKAYDTNDIRGRLASGLTKCVIPSKSNRLEQIPHSKYLYKKRHKVENFFRKIQDFRRVATRYDKLARTFLAFVQLASIFVFLRDLVNTP